ncbi:MAG: substrate-binding domain-containing protein [Nitrospirae bacterium]|nr:substrate-binding domain-containing protein [Nitrospirota bacterium]
MKCRTVADKLLLIVLSILAVAVFPVLPGRGRLSAAHPETIKIGGTGGAIGSMKELALAYQKRHPGTVIRIIPHMGTRGGIKAVLDGALDIGLAGRKLSSQELQQDLLEYEYAWSPFVFVTAGSGKRIDLTTDTVAKIYRGEIGKWPDGTPVRLLLRPQGDIDTIMLKAMSQEVRDAVIVAESRKGLMIAMDDMQNCDMLEKIKGAFGTSTLTQIIAEKRSITALPFNGVTPDIAAMVAGRYPYYKPFHLFIGPKSSPLSQAFIEFVKSPEGKRILTQTGNHVPGAK